MKGLARLPSEIISLVAAHADEDDLYECALINRVFYGAANPLLWRSINITDGDLFTKLIGCLQESPRQASLAEHVQTLHIDEPMTDAFLILFVKQISSLTKLKIYNSIGIINTVIDYLVRYCPLLEVCQIESSSHLTEKAIVKLVQHYPRLRSLSFHDDIAISPRSGAFACLQTCSFLRKLSLDVGNMADIDSVGTATQLALDLVELPHLIQLYLQHGPSHFNQILFTILSSKQKGTRGGGGTISWPNMDALVIQGCLQVDEVHVISFIKTHPGLTLLDLDTTQFSDAVLDAVATHLPDLFILNLCSSLSLTAKGIRRMVINSQSLFRLNIKQCGILG